MDARLTHEEYILAARSRVVETAKRMLSGEISFLDGANTLCSLRFEVGIKEDDPDFLTFVGIDSETHNYPMREARQHWTKDALERLEPEIDQLEDWAKEAGQAPCQSLIRRFDV